LVWLPPLDSFPKEMHNFTTDEKRQLKLEDVAGLPIGHTPKSLSGYFQSVMQDTPPHKFFLILIPGLIEGNVK